MERPWPAYIALASSRRSTSPRPRMKRCAISFARAKMRSAEHAGKHRLKAFLLRQGRRYPGRAGWTRPYRRWLADSSFPLAPQHIALQDNRDTLDETERRVERLTQQLRQLTPTCRWAPVVHALQALRGVSFVTAVGLVTEIGDIRRFTHPREDDGVPRPRPLGVLKRLRRTSRRDHQSGQPACAALLAEAAWAYQGVPRIGRQMSYRQETVPKTVCDIAWKAQLRLTGRFRTLVARGKEKSQGGHGHRARAHGIHLGHRAGGTAAARVTTRRSDRQAGGIAATWRTLENVMKHQHDRDVRA